MKIVLFALTLILFIDQAMALDKRDSKIVPPKPSEKKEGEKAAKAKTGSAKFDKKSVIAKIEKGCLSRDLDDKEKVCACIATNLGDKLSGTDLEFMARFYAGDESAEKQMEEEEKDPLAEIDADIGEVCIENPSHRIKKETKK